MMVEILFFLAFLLSVISASINDFDQQHPACFLDRIERCKHVDGLAAIFQCLEQNQSQNSPSCKASLESSPAYKCSLDSMLLCPKANTHYDLMACLWTHNRDYLSTRCVNSKFSADNENDLKFHQCRQDEMKFCHGISGLPRMMSCLADHESELSSGCRKVLTACPVFKCAHDAERFCSDVNDHRELVKCIWNHRTEVSQECKDVVANPPSLWLTHHRDRHHHGHHEGHHEDHHHGHHPKHHHDKHHHGHHEHHHKRHHEEDHHPQNSRITYRVHAEKKRPGYHRHHHHHHHHRDAEGHFRACKFDVRRFCYSVDGFVDKMACLASHEDDLSDSCRTVMDRCPAFHCAHDVQKFCPGVKNKHEFIGCLWEHRHELSDECMNQDNSEDDDHHPLSGDNCRREREKMCPKDQQKSPKYDIECLKDENQDELSHGCRKSLHIRLACKNEIDTFCRDDMNYPFECLKTHKPDLGDACKDAFDEMPLTKLTAGSSSTTSLSLTNREFEQRQLVGYLMSLKENTISMMVFGGTALAVSIMATWGILAYRKRKAHLRAMGQYQRI